MAIASLGFASGCSAKGGPWGVDHTSHQVRFEGAAVIELMNTLVKVEEGILDDVLGQGFVLGDEKRGPNGPHLVVAHQDFQSADVAALHTANGFVVIQVHSGHSCTHRKYTQTGREVGAS